MKKKVSSHQLNSSNRLKPVHTFISSIQFGSQDRPFDGIVIFLQRARALNVTQILCLWHVSSHSSVISQRTHTFTHTQSCLSVAGTSDHSLSAECYSHCHTEKAIHGALIPAVLCTAQLAGCKACLYNAAGPSTFHAPEALLATG